MSDRPIVVDFRGLKRMGWPFCKTETKRGAGVKYPNFIKLGAHPNSRLVWRVQDILDWFKSKGIDP